MYFRKFILFFVLLISYLTSFAQTQVSARVDKTYVEVKEEINLTINVISDSTDIQNPIMPSLPNFNIYSSGQARSVSMINGKVSVNLSFNYILSPRFAGKSTIGSFAVEVNGQTYNTNPIEIEVYRAGQGNAANSMANQNATYGTSSGTAASNTPNLQVRTNNINNKNNNLSADQSKKYPDFFMTAVVDKKSAYLNEQINLKIRFYQNKSTIGNPQYERPKMEGFIFEDIKTNEGYEMRGAEQYHYIEFEMALFGILPGVASIGSAKVDYVPAGNVFDAFDMFFGNTSKPQVVKTEPLEITIKPLPEQGKTNAFYGAVGKDFRIDTKIDKEELAVGQTLVLTTQISGIGNMRAIDTLPPLELGPNFRVYDSTSSSSTKIKDGLVGGVKEFKTVIVPRTSGSFSIPAIAFQYYNPQMKAYETIRSKPIALTVLPALEDPDQDSAVQTYAQQNLSQGKRVEKFASDINYLKKEEASLLNKVLTAVYDLGNYNYLLFAVLAFVILLNLISKGKFKFLSNRRAYLKAKMQISKAKSINEIAPALLEYLSTKQGKPAITIAQCAQELKLDRATTLLLNSVWQELDMLKYSPSETLRSNITLTENIQKALNLLKQIEKEAK